MPGRNFFRQLASGQPNDFIDPLSVAHLELYLRSDQISGGNGASVTTWPDLSGNGRDAGQPVAANKPTIIDPWFPSGVKAPFFQGQDQPVGDFMFRGGMTMPTTARGKTVYYFANQFGNFNTPNEGAVFCNDNGAGPRLYTQGEPSTLRYGWRNGVSGNDINTSLFATGYQSLVWVFRPPDDGTGTGEIYKDKVSQGTGLWQSADNVSTGYILNGNQVGNQCAEVVTGCVLWYSDAHDTRTRNGIINWVNRFFGE